MLSAAAPISDLGELASTSLRSLPPSGLMMAFAIMMSGLLMWAFGGRLVRPMYGFLFGVLGSGCGLFVPALVGVNTSPYIGIAVGAVVGALIGLLMFRLSMASALAVAGGVLAPLITGAVLWLNPAAATTGNPLTGDALLLPGVPVESASNDRPHEDAPKNAADTPAITFESIFKLKDLVSAESDNAKLEKTSDVASQAAIALARSAAERLRSFASELGGEAHAAWSDLPSNQQLMLAVASVLGGLGGFLLGMSFPKKVAAVGASFIGAGLWTPIAAKGMHDFSVPGHGALPSTASGWLALWLIVVAVGLILQWTVLKRKADRPARSPS
jgi:hypothetical protein